MQCHWVWAQHREPASQALLQGHILWEEALGPPLERVTQVQESEMALGECSPAQAAVGGGSEP